MEAILDFFKEVVPQIGVLPAILLVVVAMLTTIVMGYIIRINNKKDKMLKELIDKQDQQSEMTLEAMKLAISEIKELSVMSLKEVSNLSGQIGGVIEIVKALLAERTPKDKEAGS